MRMEGCKARICSVYEKERIAQGMCFIAQDNRMAGCGVGILLLMEREDVKNTGLVK